MTNRQGALIEKYTREMVPGQQDGGDCTDTVKVLAGQPGLTMIVHMPGGVSKVDVRIDGKRVEGGRVRVSGAAMFEGVRGESRRNGVGRGRQHSRLS